MIEAAQRFLSSADPVMKQLIERSIPCTLKPSFRHAVKYRRCIVPAGGFFEWRHEGKSKAPMYIHRKDDRPLGLAGIREH